MTNQTQCAACPSYGLVAGLYKIWKKYVQKKRCPHSSPVRVVAIHPLPGLCSVPLLLPHSSDAMLPFAFSECSVVIIYLFTYEAESCFLLRLQKVEIGLLQEAYHWHPQDNMSVHGHVSHEKWPYLSHRIFPKIPMPFLIFFEFLQPLHFWQQYCSGWFRLTVWDHRIPLVV